MVPHTYPSTFDASLGQTEMVVYKLSSVVGMQRWTDYIPIKYYGSETVVGGSYNSYININNLNDLTGKQAWVDYVPVYEEPNAVDAWQVSANGYIPYGSALAFAAYDALRRLGGTLIGLPDDYGLVLGPELVPSTAWVTTSGSTVSGTGSSTSASGGSPTRAALTLLPVVAGRMYVASALVTAETSVDPGVTLFARDGASAGTGTVLASDTFVAGTTGAFFFTPTSGFANLLFSVSDSSSFSVSNISVREIISAQHFIDSTGTQPVTAVGDLVGLTLDRMGTVGAELVTNGGPFVNTTSWSPFNGAALSVASGSLRVTNGNYGGATFVTTATVGKTYRVRIVRSGGTATSYQGTLLGVVTNLNAGETSVVVKATSNETTFFINSGVAGETLDISSYSVKELTGNHATQATTASKPLVARVPKRLGPNLVSNGGFDSDTAWTKGTGWTISAGKATHAAGTGSLVTNTSGTQTTPGKTYQVECTISGCTAGSIQFDTSGVTSVLSAGGSNGRYIATVGPTIATASPRIWATTSFDGSVDDVVVSEVLEWSNALSFDGSNDSLTIGMNTSGTPWVRAYTTTGTVTTYTSATTTQIVMGQPQLASRNVVAIVAVNTAPSAADQALLERFAVSQGAVL
jgi:hypothetical protein